MNNLEDILEKAKSAFIAEDYKTAFEIWKPLAEQGNAKAQNNFGIMYKEGKGVPQDYKEAIKWYRLSAEKNNPTGQYYLGKMYAMGQGIEKDYQTAIKLYNFSAEQRNSEAQKALGDLYASGEGVPEDHLLARMWYELCLANGVDNSLNCIESLEKIMTSSQIEKAKELAKNWKPATDRRQSARKR